MPEMSKDGTPVREIVAQWLRENHYDGLVNPGVGCGCGLDELMPCPCIDERGCVCAYELPVTDGNDLERMFSTSNGEQDAPSDTLEKVALDMLNAIAPLHDPCCEDTCCNLGDAGWSEDYCLHGFRDRLKALGVVADD